MQWHGCVMPRQSCGKRALPCMSCIWGKQKKRQLHSVCRQTDRPGHSCVCLYLWIQYLQYSEVHERIFISDCICERGLGNGDDRDSCELSWAQVHGARVWKMIQRLAANLPYFTLIYLAYIHQTRNLQSHTLDWRLLSVHRTKNHTTPCRKALPPTLGPLWSLPHSDLYVCSIS